MPVIYDPKNKFELIKGGTEQIALYNRINAINRVKHLSGIDISAKNVEYLYTLDLEMYDRWYKDMANDHIIDEEWCQRASIVVKDLETKNVLIDNRYNLLKRLSKLCGKQFNKSFNEIISNKQGLTLVELMITVAIIALIFNVLIN